MRLISLEIDGFKSFADKTVINFQDGVTGIIGPNGSGKSNVIEAIRWVMGEQSAKNLRGEKMVDVIFNGAKDRAPMSRAVVKLTLDNSDHFLNTPYTEVTVTRKLFRSGTSDYQLNGQSVRLKDITNLFIDSGVGKESFATISQGKVAEIFNGKPQDRRKLIEAVAGVGKYKADKELAQKRLAETNDNLNRVNDITFELKQRLEPLEEQSALAQDYLDQTKRLASLDQTATVRQLEAASQQLTAILAEKKRAEQFASDYEARVKAANQQISKQQATRQAQLKERDDWQARILQLTEKLAQVNNDQSLAAAKRDQVQAELKRLQDQAATTQADLASASATVESAAADQAKHQAAVDQAQSALAAANAADAAAQQAQLSNEIEDLRGQQVDQLQELTTYQNRVTFLTQNRAKDQGQADAAQAELTAKQAELATAQASASAAEEAVAQASAAVASAQAAQQELAEEMTAGQAAYEAAQKQWYQALGNLQSAQARVKNYQAMAVDYTGYFYGVQNVLRRRDQFQGLYGALGELIQVPKEYTLAIETALGNQLQQLVVATQATGKAIIADLTRTRGGRVTILPLDSLRGGHIPRTYDLVKDAPGVIGRAVELIQFDPRLKIAVEQLLSTTVVVDNLDHAVAVARAGKHQFRVVTLNGEVISASGAMTGGKAKQRQVGLLTQRERQREFEDAVRQAQQVSQQAEAAVQAQVAARQERQSQSKQLAEQAQAAQSKQQECQDQLRRCQAQAQELERQITALKAQTSQQDDQHAEVERAVEEARAGVTKLTAALEATKQALATKQAALTKLSDQSASQSEARHELERSLAVEDERLRQATKELKGAQARVAALTAQAADLARRIQDCQEQLAAPVETMPGAAADLQKQLDQLKARVAERTKALDDLEADLNDANAETERLQDLMRVAYDDLTRINEKRLGVENQIDAGHAHLRDDYQLTLEAAKEHQVDLPDEELHRQIKLLHRGIEELGEVNVASIAEYEQVKERYDFLANQQEDLQEAERQLKQTMEEMDQEVKDRFSQTFTALSTAFETTFQQVFAGGSAKLILTDPHDLLTTGVDIYAQPPGKKNQQLTLLSGGEKALTALALLFAILKVHPVPFAILDEPEAALDDVNVDRFATYLDRFGSEGPQFIVITHRKGTMVNADVLYGVTMQDSGVSKVITVNVDQTLHEARQE